MASLQILIEDRENLNSNSVLKSQFNISNELAYTLISELKSKEFEDPSLFNRAETERNESLLRELIFASIVVILAGMVYLIFSFLNISFALDILTIAIGLFVGMVMKSFFDFYQRSIKKEEITYSLKKEGLGSYLSFDLPILYSQKWLQIENELRDLSAKVFNGSSENEPLSLLMRKLRLEKILSAEENDQIYNLLKIRNQIVYGRSNIKKSELQRALVEADKIHSKIKTRMPST